MDFKETGCKDGKKMKPAQHHVHWQGFDINTVDPSICIIYELWLLKTIYLHIFKRSSKSDNGNFKM